MRYLLFLFVFISSTTLAQNGINYQGAATDSDGAKLVDQNISLRTSVLQGGVDGTTSYSETHNTTTDQFGLFNVVIGQGEVVSGEFDSISWGADAHFLKVELDATGGANYSLVSTTQMMSVPYAKYAENAALDSTNLSNMLASMNISSSNGGCNLNFPDGINGDIIAWDLSAGNNYTVPEGKNLYITNVHTHDGSSFRINGLRILEYNWGLKNTATQYEVGVLKLPLCVGSGQVISASNYYAYEESFYGILTDAFVEPVTFEFDDNGSGYENYTVADGKKLVITNIWMSEFAESNMRINGILFAGNIFNSLSQDVNKQLAIPIIVESGSTITIPNNHSSFNGYIVDEDYFENCGVGGGSVGYTPSGLDSAMVAEMINELATVQNFGSNSSNLTFGEFEDITNEVNENLTSVGGSLNYQQNEDGFLYFHLNNSSNGDWVQIKIDSMPITSIEKYYNPNGNMTLLFPVKKDYYWSVAANYTTAIYRGYWIEFDNNTNNISTSNIDSVMVADMISSALSAQGNSSIPTGTVQAFAGETIPDGWMLCNGSAISRTDYDDLFEVIGEKYGTGDGTFTMEWSDTNGDGNMQQDEFTNIPSTFNIPDLRGRVIVSPDNMGGNNAGVVQNLNDVGVTGGLETHTLTEAEMPSHEHDLWPVTLGGAVGGGGPGGTNTSGSWQSPGYGTILSQQAGGDQPHNNMQPYISINYIIKL